MEGFVNRNRNKVDKVTQRHYIHYKFWQLLDSDEEKSDLLCFSLRMLPGEVSAARRGVQRLSARSQDKQGSDVWPGVR